MNQRYQNVLQGGTQETPPIWMMRQAGRYHKHYQALRKKHSFVELCRVPELAAEVALGPIQDFDFDVSIFFSDLLFPLEAMGMGLEYNPAPTLSWQLKDREDLKKLRNDDEAFELLKFQGKALRCTRELLPDEKSLIGFVGSPWTLFTYAVEGAHKGSLNATKRLLPCFSEFCEILGKLLTRNIQLQLDSGAELVMLFDTAAGELSPGEYDRYLFPEIKKIVDSFPKKLAYYSKFTHPVHLEKIKKLDLAGFGIDHRWEMSQAFDFFESGFVQGNFDQSLLFADTEDFKKHLDSFLDPILDLPVEKRSRWVCGLGHGVLPATPEAHVKYFVERVRQRCAG